MIFKILTISRSPIVRFKMLTPSTPDINREELGLNHVIVGRGRPEAEQEKMARLGDVTVRSSG